MRSSDWRSDVCSSDLQVVAKLGFYRALHNIDGCAEYDLVEFLDHLAGAESTQVAAVATRGAAGVFARNFGKVGAAFDGGFELIAFIRSEEHTSELQSLMRISYAVFCLKKKKKNTP